MKQKIKTYFPSNYSEWLKYFKTSLPVILAALILSINSFIDNFMATSIKGGNQALFYANQWTQYCSGIISSTTLIGSAIFAQYYGQGNKENIQEVIRARMIIAFFIAFCFIIPALFFSNFCITIASGFDQNLDPEIIETGILYLRVITISWILQAWFYTITMVMRESGNGKISFLASLLCLSINVVLNSVLAYGLKMGILGLAISTIISLLIPIIYVSFYIAKTNEKLIFNIFKLFKVSFVIWEQIIKRLPSFFLAVLSSVCLSTRNIIWNIGYPTGSIGSNPDYKLAAANILGISGMFFNIFWTTFESLNANVAIFVGSELGKNNIEQAKTNAKKLQGFNFVLSVFIGIIFFCSSFIIEKMIFLTNGYTQQLEKTLGNEKFNILKEQAIGEYMENLKYTLWPLAWNMPIWVWYITKSRIISGGGKTNITTLAETSTSILQLIWIAILNLIIVKNTSINFPLAYSIVFLFDLLKIPLYEILYFKVKWAQNMTLQTKS